jgi:peptide deformylase
VPDDWIRQWPDPTLRAVALPTGDVDDLVRMQARRMAARLTAADGAGLAATQIGSLRRMFVFRPRPEDEVRTLVDPRIAVASEETATFVEGCLSFQAITVAVERPVAVTVTGLDADGEPVAIEAEGLDASLLQHEIDHLDGVITLDRATPAERRRAVGELLVGARRSA